MRFLMLNWRDPHNPLSGGAERVSQVYMAELARRGHDVWWFANAFPNCSREEMIDGVHVVRGGGMGTSVIAAWLWYRKQPKFDLVIDQHHGIPWYAPWWAKTNVLAYIHEVLGPIWNSFYNWPLNVLGRWQERLTHRFYGDVRFWTVCHATRRELEAAGVRRVTVSYNGVNTASLPELPPKSMAQPLRLVTVSRLAPNKRIDHAIRAVAELERRGISAQLLVIGGGEEEGKLRALVNELALSKSVQFSGAISESEKDARLRDAHLLLHTSQREGWGLNVVEANCLGTPAVVYPVPGLTESTLHDATGWLALDETPTALADGVELLLRDPHRYDRFRINAWQRARALHWSRVLPAGADWLEALARGNFEAEPRQTA